MSEKKVESAVNRWQKPRDQQRIAELDRSWRNRRMIAYIVVGLIVVALIVVAAIKHAKQNAPASSPGEQSAVTPAAAPTKAPVATKAQGAASTTEKAKTAPAANTKSAAAAAEKTQTPATVKGQTMPTKLSDIRKLESDPTDPVIKIVTTKGTMLAELYEDKAPNTVANMIELASKGFYHGMTFHRIIPGFMAQGGDPNTEVGATGTPGTGGPGYKFADEISPDLKHNARGILSMANAGPNTNGSQFFICFKPLPQLDGHYSVFGKVIAGNEVIDELEKIGTPSGKPTETVRFSIEVVAKRDHPYHVKKL